MGYVNALPADKVKVGSVFYVDGLGYAVVVLMTGTEIGKAYTSYKRPLILLRNEDGTEYKVYPQVSNKGGTKLETAHVNEEYIGDIRLNEDGNECVYSLEGDFLGVVVSEGTQEHIIKDGVVVYSNISRVGSVTMGPVCERLEFNETNKVMGMTIEENWKEILGEDASWKLTKLLVSALSKQLHTSQLTREERKWGKAVIEFREKQKPLRVDGKMFKPKASRFICGFELEGKRHLFFVKKITDVIYRVVQDITQKDAPYVIEECKDEVLRGELQKAVRDNLIPMAAYEFLFGTSSERTSQVSGQIPVDLHERMKWGGFSLPQVIHAGIQALEDGDYYANDYKYLKELPKVIKGPLFDEGKHQVLRMLLLNEDI